MKIKRFFAKDMRTALKEVKDELGVDAVIMSNKKLANGVEIAKQQKGLSPFGQSRPGPDRGCCICENA